MSKIAIAYNPKVIDYNMDPLNDVEVDNLVDNALVMLGYDEDNVGGEDWNPFKNIINNGDTVLLKPNLVMHYNGNENGGLKCLYTQPSVIASVLKHVVRALNGTGKIIVGDAPMQECDFEKIVTDSRLEEVILYYKNQGVNIELQDFRNIKTYVDKGVHKQQKTSGQDNGCVVNMTGCSEFDSLSKEQNENLRITNYDPRILAKHHNVDKHEYMVAKSILEADVIINLPKPKTHRKAGVTACLKNLIGINANKEYLPHHSIESKKEKGDAYLNPNAFFRIGDKLLDKKNMFENEGKYNKAKSLYYPIAICSKLGKVLKKEKYREGSWYGNETIWRTILDLNKILIYADKAGKIQNSPQRRILHIADMIISGENDGPVCPSPKKVGMIIAGENAVDMDEVITAIMGFDQKSIPTLRESRRCYPSIAKAEKDYSIVSNSELYNEKDTDYIYKYQSMKFIPNPGWAEKLQH